MEYFKNDNENIYKIEYTTTTINIVKPVIIRSSLKNNLYKVQGRFTRTCPFFLIFCYCARWTGRVNYLTM